MGPLVRQEDDPSRRLKAVYTTEAGWGPRPGEYGSAPTGDGATPFGRTTPARKPDRSRPRGKDQPPRPETRAALRAYWKAGRAAAEAMLLAAREQDGMGLVNAADDLDMALGKLWEFRAARDIDWQTILNHAQGLLRQAFQEKRVEGLTPEQCQSILEIVDRHLGPATKTTDDLTEVLRLIEDAGFEPYAAISGEPEPGEGV